MAEFVNVTQGSGTKMATDLVGDVNYPRVKINFGDQGSASDVATDNPLPVVISGTIPVSGTVTANQGTSPWVISGSVSATVSGTVAVSNFPSVQPVSGTVSVSNFPSIQPVSGTVSVANFPATQAVTQSTSPWVVSGTVAATQSGSWTVAATQSGSWTVGVTGTVTVSGTVTATQSGTWTTGRTWTLSNTTDSVNIGNFPATQAVTQSTSPWVVSGTVTANIGTTNGLALDTTVSALQVSQGSTTSGQKGGLTLGAVTTASPTYTTGQTSPLSLTTSGALRTDSSATTQPISGTVSISGTVPISGTITANQGTSPWVVSGTVSAAQSGAWTVTANQGGSWTVAATQSGTWTTGRTWTLLNTTDSVNVGNFPATQAVTQSTSPWVVSGTVTANQGGSWTVAATQSGSWSVSVTGTVAVTQSTSPWVVSGTVTANQGGSWTVAATQSGAWTTGRTWTLASGTDSVAAVQSGTWTVQQGSAPWSQNLTQVGGSSVTLGQATQAASIPVVTPSNSAPGTQNITAQDVASTSTTVANGQVFVTGTPTAGSAASFSLASLESVEVMVTGTWTGTLVSEISMDGGTTWFTRGVKQAGASYISSSFTANFAGGLNVSGMTNYRIRSTAAWTGTATVRIVAALAAGSITVSNPLTLRDSTTQSVANTIKAASTAPVAADTALVVAVSPNSASPTGRASVNLARNVYSTTNVTTAAYVQIIASTSAISNQQYIFDSSGQTLVLAVGGVGSEVDQFYIVPGGNGEMNLKIPSGSRVSVKAVSATANAGELNIALLG